MRRHSLGNAVNTWKPVVMVQGPLEASTTFSATTTQVVPAAVKLSALDVGPNAP
jgi:hypothetical protein